MRYQEQILKSKIERGEALIYYNVAIVWFHDGGIDAEIWDKYCLACLEELMKKNEKVLDKLKSM
jgi:hypothetical protein